MNENLDCFQISRLDMCATKIHVTIEKLGPRGAGLAHVDAKAVHIPFALPGEKATLRAEEKNYIVDHIHASSPYRIDPVCTHFTICGGCSLQHVDHAEYSSWKTSLVTEALKRVGITAPNPVIHHYPLKSRRRIKLSARRVNDSVELGYKAEKSNTIIDIVECPIADQSLVATLPALRAALQICVKRNIEARIYLTLAANGIDCVIIGDELSMPARHVLTEAVRKTGIIRLIWNSDVVLSVLQPVIRHGSIDVPLPSNAFLQAIAQCEQDMATFMLQTLKTHRTFLKSRICDLFAGLGAFSFPAAQYAPVTAFEMSSMAVKAMTAASQHAQSIKPFKAIRRDLYRGPLSASELNAFSCAIVDPPREGCEAQCQAIAASNLPLVIAFSCNPSSFARDAAVLYANGFTLTAMQLYDQFKYSHHVEIGAVFQRPQTDLIKKRSRATFRNL